MTMHLVDILVFQFLVVFLEVVRLVEKLVIVKRVLFSGLSHESQSLLDFHLVQLGVLIVFDEYFVEAVVVPRAGDASDRDFGMADHEQDLIILL